MPHVIANRLWWVTLLHRAAGVPLELVAAATRRSPVTGRNHRGMRVAEVSASHRSAGSVG